MAAPPASNTISMVIERWKGGTQVQFSPVHRINGFPLRLQVTYYHDGPLCDSNYANVFLICEKSSEADLWKCTAMVKDIDLFVKQHVFCSWQKWSWMFRVGNIHKSDTSKEITIAIEKDSWCSQLRPIRDSIKPPNGILVIGEEKKEIEVNKEFLASQSPYFNTLFFGNFDEKNMDKIPIGDVGYEEFNNIIKMAYGNYESGLTENNVHRVLELADRFDLKIVEDRVISYLLSSFSSFSLAQKLLLSEEKNIPLIKKLSLESRGIRELRNVQNSPEFADFSEELKAEIIRLV